LRRTYKDSTEALKQVVVDFVKDGKKPPEPNAKEEPGYGPEVKAEDPPREKKDGDKKGGENPAFFHDEGPFRSAPGGPVFAVIPQVSVGGLLAILALFSPAAAAALALALRRWLAVLTVLSVNSTLFAVHLWCYDWIKDQWFGSFLALWTAMTLVTVLGT